MERNQVSWFSGLSFSLLMTSFASNHALVLIYPGFRKDLFLYWIVWVYRRKSKTGCNRFPFEVKELTSPSVLTEDLILWGNDAICLDEGAAGEGRKKKTCFFSGRNGEISPFSNLVKADSCGHFSAWVAQQKAAPCELADAKREREKN